MGERTGIEWTDHTFNPWIGCAKVSPGCANCYAETLMDKRHGRARWGPGQSRSRTAVANWRKVERWHRAAQVEGVLRRVFCASLADWLDDEVPVEWLADLLDLVAETTDGLVWQLLTKRPENWRPRLEAVVEELMPGAEEGSPGTRLASTWLAGTPPPNVWAGTSVENQDFLEIRARDLLRISALVHFFSCEPLLGPLDFDRVCTYSNCDGECGHASPFRLLGDTETGNLVDWVIVGGESGQGSVRPMHPQWARSIRDQCEAAGVPFFFKQWGEWQAGSASPRVAERERIMLNDGRLIRDPGEMIPADRYSKSWGPAGWDANVMAKVGKKAAGSLLDGREWKEFPA